MAGTSQKLAARRAPLSLTEYDLRYLRKAVRFRIYMTVDVTNQNNTIGYRTGTPPRDRLPDGVVISPERAVWLDAVADWMLDVSSHPPMPVEARP